MTTADPIMDLLAGQLADAEAGWSVGTFGAIAEFTREPGDALDTERSRNGISVVTEKGGIGIVSRPDLRLIASESPTTESWSQRVAMCLPHEAGVMSGRTVLTEIGPDRAALRHRDRNGILFDLGLGTLQIDACIRTGEADVVAALRSRTGQSVFAPDSDAMRVILAANPHRVFVSRIGRAEVFQPIPPPAAKALMARTRTSCQSCSRIAAPMLRPSRCPMAGSPVRIFIRPIRCAINSAASTRFGRISTQRSRPCSNATGCRS